MKYLCSFIIIFLIFSWSSLSAAEKDSTVWGEYRFSKLCLIHTTTGWTWRIKLYNAKSLADKLKGYKQYRISWGTACTIIGKPDVKATLFLRGLYDDEVIIYSNFFAYNRQLRNKFPLVLHLAKPNLLIAVLGPCQSENFP
jgi:hypothetical protein